MSIYRLEQDMQHVPDNVLVGYVQNPQNAQPGASILALAELQKRKQMRAATQGNGAPQPTIAQQVVGQQPQGLSAIPTQNVGDEATYAQGGIVSFAQGGTWVDGKYLTQEEIDARYADALNRSFLMNPSAYAGKPDNLAGETIRTPVTVRPEDLNPMQTYRGSAAKQLPSEVFNEIQLRGAGITTPATGNNKFMDDTTPTADKRQPSVPVEGTPDAAGSVKASQRTSGGIAGTPAASKLKWNNVAGADYSELIGAETDPEAERARRVAYMGEDEGIAGLRERAAAMRQENDQNKARDPWMALATAGLGMAAGTSPFAITNIGAGGQKGIEALTEAKAKTQAREDKLYDMESKLAQAVRAEREAAFKFGEDSAQHKNAQRRTAMLEQAKATAENAMANEQGRVGVEKTNAQMTDNAADRASRERIAAATTAATREQTNAYKLMGLQQRMAADINDAVEKATAAVDKRYEGMATAFAMADNNPKLAQMKQTYLNERQMAAEQARGGIEAQYRQSAPGLFGGLGKPISAADYEKRGFSITPQ